MKKGIVITVIAVAVLVGGFFKLSSPSNEDSGSNATASTQPTTFSDVESAVASGGQLIDVRTTEEYAAGHIDGATLLSLQDIEAGTLPSGSKDQALFVYCRSGSRSSQATAILEKAGYTNVTDLGAITAVQDMGGKIVTGS